MIKQIITLLFLIPFLAYSQNYKEDMCAVLQSVKTMKTYSMRIHYRLYLDGNTTKAFQESFTDIKKSETGVFCKQSSGQEFISNRNYEISLDAAAQSITAKRKREREYDVTGFVAKAIENLDTLLSTYSSIKVVNTSKTGVTYRLTLKKNQAIQSILVGIDKKKKMLTKIQYHYKDAMEIGELKNTKHTTIFEIAYEDLSTGLVIDTKLFDEKKYIVFAKGKIRPAPKYKGYTLHILN